MQRPLETDDGRTLLKLVESPFYPAGGGQVSDSGEIACEHGDCRARVESVLRDRARAAGRVDGFDRRAQAVRASYGVMAP